MSSSYIMEEKTVIEEVVTTTCTLGKTLFVVASFEGFRVVSFQTV